MATLTNGANFRGSMAEAFARYGEWVRVSQDAFTRLLENVRAFAACGSACVLGVSLIVDARNCGHVADICRMMKDAGGNHVKVSGAIVANDVQENNLYHRRIHDVVARQMTEARALSDDKFTMVDHYHELEERFEKSYDWCPSLQYLTVIGADCRVYTCQDKAYTGSGRLGSLEGRRFRDFWFSEENRAGLRLLDPSRVCRHHCVAHQKNLLLHEILSIDAGHGCFV